jgi:hypothetical protein
MAPLHPRCVLPLFTVWFWRMAFRNEPGRRYDHCWKRSTVDILSEHLIPQYEFI